ncbi:MAG: diacylglycerol kinase [bacterium]|nr:diacylglycerol kinase [bacterium]
MKLKSVHRIYHALQYSVTGMKVAFSGHEAFRQELFLTVLAVPLAFYIGESVIELLLLIGSLIIVLVVELLNSAVETTIDRISSDRHPLSGQAKDLGSAAVMIALVWAAITWMGIAVL